VSGMSWNVTNALEAEWLAFGPVDVPDDFRSQAFTFNPNRQSEYSATMQRLGPDTRKQPAQPG
jgi:hypothetical protein